MNECMYVCMYVHKPAYVLFETKDTVTVENSELTGENPQNSHHVSKFKMF